MGARFGTTIDTRSPTFATMSEDAAVLAQIVHLILDTQTGVYWSAPECGKSIRGYLLRGLTPADIARIPAEVSAALKNDERIAGADVTATPTFTAGGGEALRLDIIVTPNVDPDVVFTLTATASADLVNVITRGLP